MPGAYPTVVTRLYSVMAVITLFARSTGNQAVRLDLLLDGDSNKMVITSSERLLYHAKSLCLTFR